MPDIEDIAPPLSIDAQMSSAPTAAAHHDVTAEDHAFLREQLDAITDVLRDYGYLDGAQSPAEAVWEMAEDAAEALRAREVLYADEVLDEQHDIAEALSEATHLAGEHQQILEMLAGHDETTGGGTLPEAVETLLYIATKAEDAAGLLVRDGRMGGDEDLPRAVGQLITESAERRALLIEGGLLH